ncbi:kinase-like domain-containing protein [Paraphoma chrysanthemicola]|uniref:Kinase-like domain-containing protein n=1 Tax=Paraphoma chrysanthemicola TaxID=798071 RepID=A0A8K0R0T4_9PLEO|nr:kinase-like domain-containing protein [Paraphoma chrysanthemicola]
MSIDDSYGFSQPRYLSNEAYMPAQEPDTLPYSLINFIAVAQRLKLSFLRITWQAARHGLGTGATGSIREALINLHTSFAFKCVSDRQKEKQSEDWIMRSFINEVIAHSHPSIERHPRVAHLEGVCWDVATDEQGEDHVWPVLVFVKSQYGDLANFMTLPAGRELGLKERVSLCLDLGWAVSDMHAHGFVHGDIKPANALVFRNKEKYIAKVIDFGFSSQFADQNELLFVAASWPWYAPERDRDRVVAAQVQEMDMFSYGMLCFWVMFERHLSGIVPLPEEAQWAEKYFEEEQQHSGSLSLSVLDGLKRDEQLTRLAKQLIKDDKNSDDDDLQELGRFFDEILSYNPEDRVHAFEQFPYRKL